MRLGQNGRAEGAAVDLPRLGYRDDHSSTDFYIQRVGCPEAQVYHSIVARMSQKKSPNSN